MIRKWEPKESKGVFTESHDSEEKVDGKVAGKSGGKLGGDQGMDSQTVYMVAHINASGC